MIFYWKMLHQPIFTGTGPDVANFFHFYFILFQLFLNAFKCFSENIKKIIYIFKSFLNAEVK